MPRETRSAIRKDIEAVQDYENDDEVGYISTEDRKMTLDKKSRARAKELLVCLKSEEGTLVLLGCADSRLSVLEDILNSLKARSFATQSTSGKSFSNVVSEIGFLDSILLMTQLVLTVERYLPRTKHSEGTPQVLKNSHMLLAKTMVNLISTSWLICHSLGIHDKDADVKRFVRGTMPKLLRLLKPATVSVGKQLLGLIMTWCTAYKFSFFEDSFLKSLVRELPKILHKGDFELQWLIGKVLQMVWKTDRNGVVEFIKLSCMGPYAKEICAVLVDGKSNVGASKRVPYELAFIFNRSLGVHRRIFSFPIQSPVNFSQTVDMDEPSPQTSPHDFLDRDPWSLHFSLDSETLSFEISTTSSSSRFLHIPFSSVASFSAAADAARTATVTFLLVTELVDFMASDLSRSPCGNLRADFLSFTLKIEDAAQLALLKTALEESFGSLDTEKDIILPKIKQIEPVKTEDMEERTPVVWTREFEEAVFRDLLPTIDMMIHPMQNNNLPEKENVSKRTTTNGVIKNGKPSAGLNGTRETSPKVPQQQVVVLPINGMAVSGIPAGSTFWVMAPLAAQSPMSLGNVELQITALPQDLRLTQIGTIVKTSSSSSTSSEVVQIAGSPQPPNKRSRSSKISPAEITTIH